MLQKEHLFCAIYRLSLLRLLHYKIVTDDIIINNWKKNK